MRAYALVPLPLLAGLAFAAGTKGSADERKLWAYPKGVIVTTGGLHVGLPGGDTQTTGTETAVKTAKEAERAAAQAKEQQDALQAVNDELTALDKALEARLTDCLAALRAKQPELVKAGTRYGFTLDFRIAADGTVQDPSLRAVTGSAPLPNCADATQEQLAAHAFEPSSLGTPLEAHLGFEGLILTDDEAKGRGYQYYESERLWEQAKKTHHAWFACKKDDECAVTAEACELHAVNTAQLAAFREAAAARKKPGCRTPDITAYTAACRRGVCAARRSGR